MTERRPLFVNGRFLTQPLTGVQRAAQEVTKALAARADVELLAPRGHVVPDALRHVPIRTVGHTRGHLWEQTALVAASRHGFLVNLGNVAPILKRDQLVMVHDVGVFTFPEAFSRPFIAWYRFVLRRLAASEAAFVTDSAHARGELIEHLRVSESRVTVAPLGADHILRTPSDIDLLARSGLEPGTYVLSVGGSTTRKNLGAVGSAVAQVAGGRLRLAVVGSFDERIGRRDDRSLDAIALGRVDDGGLRALYENAACLVFPSLHEGFGLPPVEAMVCGCPVVASGIDVLRETCADGAVYCDPYDPSDIARAIEVASTPGSERDELIRKGRARGASFTWERCGDFVLAAMHRA